MSETRARAKGWRSLADEGGASATEFALVLPLLVFLLFGFFEVGRLIFSYSIVNAAVRDAARYAARQQMDCSSFSDANQLTYTRRLARTGTVDAGGAPLLPNWTDDTTVTVTISCLPNPTGGTTYAGLYEGLTQIPTVKVAVAAPYSGNLTILFPSLNLTTIQVAHSEVWGQQ